MQDSVEERKQLEEEKIYENPELQVYGTVEQITFGGGGSKSDRGPGNTRS